MLKGRGLGMKIGRVIGRKKVFSCVFLVKCWGFKVFVLCWNRICYGICLFRMYVIKFIIKGCFRVGVGGLCFIDVYMIGKGMWYSCGFWL